MHKNALEELKSNLEEVVKYCDDHPNATTVKGGDRTPSTCAVERAKYEAILKNETATSPTPQTN